MPSSQERLPEIESYVRSRWDSERTLYVPEKISPKFIEIAEQVAELTGTWNPVEIFTPDPENLAAEKKKFFQAFDEGVTLEPSFHYDVAEQMDVSQTRRELETLLSEVSIIDKGKKAPHSLPLNPQERLFRVALVAKIKDDLATCDLIEGIKQRDEARIAQAMKRKYPSADETLIQYAQQRYEELISPETTAEGSTEPPLLSAEQQQRLREMSFDAHQIKAAFEWALSQYGLLRTAENPIGYAVVVSERATDIDVRDKSQNAMTVFIPANKTVSGDKLLQLMAHEIEGHCRQSINGMKMFLLGGGPYKLDGEILYEGLAKRYDESFHRRFFGKDTGIPEPWYALAVSKATEGATFSEIFQDQFQRRMHVALGIPADQELSINKKEHQEAIETAKNQAWRTTYRVMRGHVDMTNPQKFAMSKDLAYLQGWLMDQQLQQAGYGSVNEMGVIQAGGLQLLARTGVNSHDIPHPYQDVVKDYYQLLIQEEVGNEENTE